MALRGPVKLSCDELSVPGENRLRLDGGGNILEGLFSQSLAELGQRVALGIDEPYPARDLPSQDAGLRHELFIPQQQFLVDRTCDVSEYGFHSIASPRGYDEVLIGVKSGL